MEYFSDDQSLKRYLELKRKLFFAAESMLVGKNAQVSDAI